MLKGKRITIEPLATKHLEAVRRLRNSQETYPFLGSALPVNESSQTEWLRRVSLDPTKMYFAVLDAKRACIGFVRCDEWDKVNGSIRVGIDIAPQKRRHGYAREAYRLLLTYLFRQLRMHRVWLLVLESNNPALSLYKALGFRDEGIMREAIFRNGSYHNYLLMGLLDTEYGAGT